MAEALVLAVLVGLVSLLAAAVAFDDDLPEEECEDDTVAA